MRSAACIPFLALVTALSSCDVKDPLQDVRITDTYKHRGVDSVSNYPVDITRQTPGGVWVDDPGNMISDQHIDEVFEKVEACLRGQEPRRLSISEISIYAGNCSQRAIPDHIDRQGLVVKIAPDWYISKCSGQQLFPCDIDSRGCDAKGLPPDQQCPCACRSGVQWEVVVVVPPNGFLLSDALIRAVTRCNNPWVIPRLAACAAPGYDAPTYDWRDGSPRTADPWAEPN